MPKTTEAAMDPTCPACTAGPSRIEGHNDLRVQNLGSTQVTFKCTICRAMWSRTEQSKGEFTWTRIDPDAPTDARRRSHGVPVPTRH